MTPISNGKVILNFLSQAPAQPSYVKLEHIQREAEQGLQNVLKPWH